MISRVPRDAKARFVRAACIAVAAIATADAQAQSSAPPQPQTRTLYRWTDDKGRIQYSDKPPPASFKGEVTRLEMDTETTAPPVPASQRPPVVSPEVLRDVTPAKPDIAKNRRDTRARLELGVQRAEEKVATAKAAIAAGGDPKDDERQFVQRQYAQAQPGRSNCRAITGADGKPTVVCPAMVPNEQYYDRMRALEEALRQAEEELSDAKAAYRHGVD